MRGSTPKSGADYSNKLPSMRKAFGRIADELGNSRRRDVPNVSASSTIRAVYPRQAAAISLFSLSKPLASSYRETGFIRPPP